MKRLLIIVVILAVMVTVATYVLIPAELEVSKTAHTKATPNAAFRHLSGEAQWEKWWPSAKDNLLKKGDSVNYTRDDISFDVIHKTTEAFAILILQRGKKLNSILLFLPLKGGATALHWKCLVKTGNDPISKIQSYQAAKSIRKKMEIILDTLTAYLERPENIYGITIQETTVTDTLLIATKANFDHYPTVDDVFQLVKNLKHYIADQNAKETNSPMLHIEKVSNQFETMVGIPIDKPVQNSGNFALKRMVPGQILIAQVSGGPHSIKKAFGSLELYLMDNDLASHAIPFESLVTNRLTEPDTAKWITRIYYPIY